MYEIVLLARLLIASLQLTMLHYIYVLSRHFNSIIFHRIDLAAVNYMLLKESKVNVLLRKYWDTRV